jgi:hypothetical protein
LSIVENGKTTNSELIATIEENKVTIIRYNKSSFDNLFLLFLFEDICCFSWVFKETDKKELYLKIAIANIALRNNLPANQVCGIKYFKNKISSILSKEIVTCNKSIKTLTRKPMPINRLNLSLKVRALEI